MINQYPFVLQPLNYDYSALEPVISKSTLTFHHDKHLQAYTDNLNNALSKDEDLQQKTLEEILTQIEFLNSSIATAVKNNGGGVYNHNFYFEALTSPSTTKPSAFMESKLIENFGSVASFLEEFKKAALSVFGSGWAWLVEDKNGKLKIVQTPNQETPLKDGLKPILTIDVWEHAYYLDYQNKRAQYIDEYFKIINWDILERRLNSAT